MSSLARLLSIFDFFDAGNAVLTADEIVSKLGCSRPQGYRYIRELCTTGFLCRFSGAYSLGPRIIELDYVIRSGDPALRIAEPFIRELRNRVACDVILVKMFGDHLVALHHERCNDTTLVGYGRGRPMPIFRGCGYKVILAHLPAVRQKRLFQQYPDAVKASELGHTWEEMRVDLLKIRKSGYALSFGELDPVNVGIAAPVFDDEPGAPPNALTLVVPRVRFETSNREMLTQILKTAAADISYHLQRHRKQ